MLKKLITGKLSLPMTFWGWGFGGGVLITLVRKAGIHTDYLWLVPVSYMMKIILSLAVLSGLTFMLREKRTVLGVMAFTIFLAELIVCTIIVVMLATI